MAYPKSIPRLADLMFPALTWRFAPGQRKVYLTFDDGPYPETTGKLLQWLEEQGAKATFFCSGRQAAAYPELIDAISLKGHRLGNHGFDHLNGWRTGSQDYLQNAERASRLITSSLFRPPYGKIRPSQARKLAPKYRIIMWSVMPGDFDPSLSASDCLEICKRNITDGSIVVLHDNPRAIEKLKDFLPELMHYLYDQGYSLESIPT